MIQGVKLLIYPVKDIAQAKTMYGRLLGVDPYVDSPYYVGFKVGEQEIGLDPNGHSKGMTGPLEYWQVADIQESLQSFLDAGAQVHQTITEVGGGKQIASVKDPDGNIIGLIQQT